MALGLDVDGLWNAGDSWMALGCGIVSLGLEEIILFTLAQYVLNFI